MSEGQAVIFYPPWLDNPVFLFRMCLIMTSLEATVRKCREHRMRITPQRILILRYLLDNRSHPTAEDIYRAVCRTYPNISLATVYNTLNMLVELGEIRELPGTNASKRFDPNLHSHDHALCEVCGRLFDVAQSHDGKREIQAMGKRFTVRNDETLYRGRCWICSTMANPADEVNKGSR